MTNDEKYEYWIAAVLRTISDLQYERKNLQKQMEENRKKMKDMSPWSMRKRMKMATSLNQINIRVYGPGSTTTHKAITLRLT